MTQPVCHDDYDIAVLGNDAVLENSASAAEIATVEVPGANEAGAVLLAVREAVGEQNFEHWFHKRSRLLTAGDQLLVHVPNPFILNWVLKRFRSQLTVAAQRLLGPSGSCQLEVDSSLILVEKDSNSAAGAAARTTLDQKSLTHHQATERKSSAGKNTFSGGPQKSSGRSSTSPVASEQVLRSLPIPNGEHSGRRKFRSFGTFISGDCNELAVLAARQVAAAPGERYNPLYIHGGTGTGKTHLLEAIYSEVRRTRSQANVMYLNSESFTNYFTTALSSRTVPSFRQRFRNVDVLLIDNVEFLDNKRATQEEFLHTIVQVIEHGGQVVVSSDRHPRMLIRHREELTTRFMSGLVCRIESPDEVTCSRVTRSLAMNLRANFSDEALEYVARRCRRNVREIQGALNSLDGHFSINARRITLNTAREVLGELSQECRRLVRISDVEKVICEAFGVTAADLRSPSRRKAVSFPRAVAMFMSRKLTKSAYREIGSYFGGRDHSTVVAAERRVAEWIEANQAVVLPNSCSGKTIADVIEELEARLMSLAS